MLGDARRRRQPGPFRDHSSTAQARWRRSRVGRRRLSPPSARAAGSGRPPDPVHGGALALERPGRRTRGGARPRRPRGAPGVVAPPSDRRCGPCSRATSRQGPGRDVSADPDAAAAHGCAQRAHRADRRRGVRLILGIRRAVPHAHRGATGARDDRSDHDRRWAGSARFGGSPGRRLCSMAERARLLSERSGYQQNRLLAACPRPTTNASRPSPIAPLLRESPRLDHLGRAPSTRARPDPAMGHAQVFMPSFP